MVLSDEQKKVYRRKWEGKSLEEQKLAASIRLGRESAEANFPELFSSALQSQEGAVSPYGGDRNVRVLARTIGIVRWYNGANRKVCGIVVTNNFGTEEASMVPGRFLEVEILRGSWKEQIEPDAGAWISFSLKKVHGKYIATKARNLDALSDELLDVALQYVGDFSRIKGEVKESRAIVRYDREVIASCIERLKFAHREDWQVVARAAIRKRVESIPRENWRDFVDGLITTPKNFESLRSVYLPQDEYVVDDDDVVAPFLQRTFVDRFLADMDVGTLKKIPSWVDLHGNQEQIGHLVETSSLPVLAEMIRTGLVTAEEYATTIALHINRAMEGPSDAVWQFVERLLADTQTRERSLAFLIGLEELVESAYALFFAVSGDEVFVGRISDVPVLVDWLQKQTPGHVLGFLRGYGQIADPDVESDPILSELETAKIAAAVRLLPEAERYSFLTAFPKSDVLRVVWGEFRGDALFSQCIGELWEAEKAKVPCVVFDLESDGEELLEFAFRAQGNTRSYSGEEQLESLGRALQRHSIVIGHNVKKWDLPILEKKGLTTSAFVWDTLEIEILLDPCRYAYSLHAVHHAKEDAELTDALFWDQLYRLSLEPELCERFADFFPAEIRDVIQSLRKPWFAELFQREARSAAAFFQEPGALDASIVTALDEIGPNVGEGTALIVAPRELWGYIAQHVEVSFMDDQDALSFRPLEEAKLASYPFDSPLHRAILERYIGKARTPIPANLSQYLRIGIFSDAILSALVSPTKLRIRCVDVDEISAAVADGPVDHVYLIGTELVNRLHQYRLPDIYDAAAFLDRKCWIPMRLAASEFVAATEEDRRCIASFAGEEILVRAQNVWVERETDGRFLVGYSLDFKSVLEAELKKMPDAKVHHLPWNRVSSVTPETCRLVTSERAEGTYDPTENRVTSVAPAKAAYWVYQFKLLESVSADAETRPIVYVVDDGSQIAAVRAYATHKGYQVPPEIGIGAAQAWMRRRPKSLMVIGRDELPRFLALRSESAFAIVFDCMSVEKCMAMWRGMTFGDEAKLAGASEIGTSGVHHVGTPRDAMLSAWPLFVHYHRMVLANNGQSRVYFLDPYLDDYPELADSWNAKTLPAPTWHADTTYSADLADVREIFPVPIAAPQRMTEAEISVAMDVIRAMLLSEGASWRDYQIPVLRAVLSKEHDLVVSIPTGGGKSVLFQGPALYQSMKTNRLSIVITPLKALMQDQVSRLRDYGFSPNVEYLNSDCSYFETRQIYRRIGGGEISLLYVTPERFRSRAFINALDRRIAQDDGLEYFVFDEAHCVSQWGQEFRPDYLHVLDWCSKLKSAHPGTCATFYSATMTGLIENDIRAYVEGVKRVGQPVEDYNPIREHIGMAFRQVAHSDDARIKAIEQYIREKDVDAAKSRMLVFCLLRQQCEDASDALLPITTERLNRGEGGIPAVDFFHAGLDGDVRKETLERFSTGKTPYLCATKAFGMGMDIPNVHYIVHYSPPRVLEDYLQEVGRAGRNEAMYKELGFGKQNPLPAVCLYSREDFRRHADKLKTGELVWSDLKELHEKIVSFAREMHCLKRMQDRPVVIPTNFWSKGDKGDVTSLRVALYWLECLQRIRLGYIMPACIHIELTEKEFDFDAQAKRSPYVFVGRSKPQLAPARARRAKAVWERVRQFSAQRGNMHIQVQQSELRVRGRVSARQVMDALIDCAKVGVLEIRQLIRCEVSVYRNSETRYVCDNRNHRRHVALHWMFELANSVLRKESSPNGEIRFEAEDEERVLADLKSGAMAELDKLLQNVKTENGSVKKLPWYNAADQMDNQGFTNPASYRDDFLKKRVPRVYELLSMAPGVSVRAIYRRSGNVHIIRNVVPETIKWLDAFEADCWTLLEKIRKLPFPRDVRWQELMRDSGLMDKGFDYFSSVMGFLSSMSYIETESLLPFGIEAYGTNRTEDPIATPPKADQDDYPSYRAFEEVSAMRVVRLAAMAAFSRLHREQYDAFIQEYFRCSSYADYMAFVQRYAADDEEIMALLTDKALEEQERMLTKEQKTVYEAPLGTNVNVLAGPGAGKTHVLTLRCARLIYKEGVDPSQILVLAYNRAVIVELKNRLDHLFRGLGLSRRASRLHVHTYHSLAKRVCGEKLAEMPMDQWEQALAMTLTNDPQKVYSRLSTSIRYVLIDEFQDITSIRLDVMDRLRDRYPSVSFFTIGDKNQSIYGFERRAKGDPMGPGSYYERLVRDYQPLEYRLRTNFRSYQGILDSAANFIPHADRVFLPQSAPQIMASAPAEPCVEIIDNRVPDPTKYNHWPRQFESVVKEARERGYSDVAVFFRTNAEVYRGYSRLRGLNLGDAVIRIQGTSGELWRTREVFSVISYLKQRALEPVVFDDERTRGDIRKAVEKLMLDHPSWDQYYLDLAFTLVLDVLDELEGEIGAYTYGDLAALVKETAQRDEGQCHKIYSRHREGCIDQRKRLNIVLTTMHKVKGLEFDSVVITPSYAPLPLKNDQPPSEPLTAADIEDVEEERRLLFVAYTRAKKRLRVYKWNREFAVESAVRTVKADAGMGYRDRDELDKLYLSYLASKSMYVQNAYVEEALSRNEPLTLAPATNYAGKLRYVAKYQDRPVACLASGSKIVQGVSADCPGWPKPVLAGVFVSDILVWTYEDTLNYDQSHGTSIAESWCDDARRRGYVYVVDFAGYAKAPKQ